jgi:hypothetical protein
MHIDLARKYAAIKTAAKIFPEQRSCVHWLDQAQHYTFGQDVIEHARAMKRWLAQHTTGPIGFPKTSALPHRSMTISGSHFGTWLLRQVDSEPDWVQVWSVDRVCGLFGWYRVGAAHGALPRTDRLPESMRFASEEISPEEVPDCLAWIAFIVATINTPRAADVAPVEPSRVRRDQVRRLTGRAALAWTHVTVRPGAVQAVRLFDEEISVGMPLHVRKGHWAWVPSQRKTAKSEWLEFEAGPRGVGWYVFREETEVGDERYGIKCQIRDVLMPGIKRRRNKGDADPELAQERREALGAAQRALAVRAGQAPTAAVH